MKVLVCGSRSWTSPYPVRLRLYDLAQANRDLIVIHGAARGPDRAADDAAKDFHLRSEAFPADWEKHGKRAGFVRNLQMLDEEPDLVLAFWDGKSRGTEHTISEARKRGIPVEVIVP